MTVYLYPRGAAPAASVTLRENLASWPHLSGVDQLAAYLDTGAGTGGVMARELSTLTAPDGRAGFARVRVTTAATGGTQWVSYRDQLPMPGDSPAGYVVSAYVRSSATRTVRVLGQYQPAAFPAWFAFGTAQTVTLPAGAWTRVSVAAVDSATRSANLLGIRVEWDTPLGAGATFDLACVLIERTPIERTLRRNYALDPQGRATVRWLYQTGTGEAASRTTIGPGAADGPVTDGGHVRAYVRTTVTTPKTGGTSGAFYRTLPGEVPHAAGDRVSMSFYVRSSVATTVTPSGQLRNGTTVVSTLVGSPVALAANAWTRVELVMTATGAGNGVQLWMTQPGTTILPAAATIDTTACLLELAPELRPYLDGDTPATASAVSVWDGAAYESASRAYAVQLAPLAYFDGATPDEGYPGVDHEWLAVAHNSRSLAVLHIPEVLVETELALEYEGTERTRTELLDVIGRVDPIPVLGPGGLRAGRLELWLPDHPAALAAQRAHRGVVMRYVDTEYPELAMDYVATSTSVTPEPYQTKVRRWRLAIDYAEVAAA